MPVDPPSRIYCYSEGLLTATILRHELALYHVTALGLTARHTTGWQRNYLIGGNFSEQHCTHRTLDKGTFQDPQNEIKCAPPAQKQPPAHTRTCSPPCRINRWESGRVQVRVNEYPVRNESCAGFFKRLVLPMLRSCSQQPGSKIEMCQCVPGETSHWGREQLPASCQLRAKP